MAYVYLENADQAKYGSILSGLNTQNSLRNEQYPKTLIEANNVLSNHEFDKKSVASNKRNEEKTRANNDLIKNCPITVEDIDNSEKIFGADIPIMKGKVTRQKPIPVVEDMIEIPQELRMTQVSVTFCVDVMHVNSLIFLITTSRNLY